jgi:hypothetical protein
MSAILTTILPRLGRRLFSKGYLCSPYLIESCLIFIMLSLAGGDRAQLVIPHPDPDVYAAHWVFNAVSRLVPVMVWIMHININVSRYTHYLHLPPPATRGTADKYQVRAADSRREKLHARMSRKENSLEQSERKHEFKVTHNRHTTRADAEKLRSLQRAKHQRVRAQKRHVRDRVVRAISLF